MASETKYMVSDQTYSDAKCNDGYKFKITSNGRKGALLARTGCSPPFPKQEQFAGHFDG
jgi:hypothetical protein